MFYDVKLIGEDEAAAIGPCLASEGAIVLVPPTGAPSLALCTSIDDFIARGGAEVRSRVVAGVGSSALGASAFARNVADAMGQTVAAVVSGYGLADVATEALGGFFLFGKLNSIRHPFESLDRIPEFVSTAEQDAIDRASNKLFRKSKDTLSVVALLERAPLRFDRLIGHSEGNLVVSEAPYHLGQGSRRRALVRGQGARSASAEATVSGEFSGFRGRG